MSVLPSLRLCISVFLTYRLDAGDRSALRDVYVERSEFLFTRQCRRFCACCSIQSLTHMEREREREMSAASSAFKLRQQRVVEPFTKESTTLAHVLRRSSAGRVRRHISAAFAPWRRRRRRRCRRTCASRIRIPIPRSTSAPCER